MARRLILRLLLPIVLSIGSSGQSRTVPDLDRLLQQREYLELRSALDSSPGLPPHDRAFFEAVLANRANRLAESIRQLEALLPALRTTRSEHEKMALRTLGDNYVKSSRYADAYRAYEDLDRRFRHAMNPPEWDEIAMIKQFTALLGDGPAQTVEVDGPFTIQGRKNAAGLVEVPVQVGKGTDFWMLDTGASFCSVSESAARRLGLHVSSSTGKARGVDAKTPLRAAVLPELRLGRAVLRNVPVMVTPDRSLYFAPAQMQLHLILGYAAISALGRITFLPRGRISVERSRFEVGSSSLLMDELQALLVAEHAGKSMLFVFDTGASKSLFVPRYYRAFQPEFSGLTLGRQSVPGIGGTRDLRAYHPPRLALAFGGTKITLHNAIVLTEPVLSGVSNYYGLIGQDVLSQFSSYTLDFGAMQFIARTDTVRSR